MKKLSVIVCVFNREDTLPQCLDALTSQTLSTDKFEVIVVDNASTDSSPEIAASYARKNKNLRVCREEKLGLAAARNRGMKEAKSGIAAFTDDDAIPSSTWCELLLARFEELDEKTVAVGGELDPIWKGQKPEWLTGNFFLHPLSVSLGWSDYARHLLKDEWLCEANSAYRIAPLVERGGFPEQLGRVGENLLSGENAINSLLLRDGYRFFFDPDIRVGHQIAPQRMTQEWFRRRFFWQGITTFHVNEYLRKNNCDVPQSTVVSLPMNEGAWEVTLSNCRVENFETALRQLFDLGYSLAACKILMGAR